MRWRAKYMIDPGDGLLTTVEFDSTDNILDAVTYVYENFGEHFIVSLEII